MSRAAIVKPWISSLLRLTNFPGFYVLTSSNLSMIESMSNSYAIELLFDFYLSFKEVMGFTFSIINYSWE